MGFPVFAFPRLVEAIAKVASQKHQTNTAYQEPGQMSSLRNQPHLTKLSEQK